MGYSGWLFGFSWILDKPYFYLRFHFIPPSLATGLMPSQRKMFMFHWTLHSSFLTHFWDSSLLLHYTVKILIKLLKGHSNYPSKASISSQSLYKHQMLHDVQPGDSVQFSSVQFSCSVVSDSLRHPESQHARPRYTSPIHGVYSNSCPLSQWCHPAIWSSVVPFSSYPQSLPASGSFPMSQLFPWGGQSIGVSASASVLPMNTQDWYHLGRTGWISL